MGTAAANVAYLRRLLLAHYPEYARALEQAAEEEEDNGEDG